MSSRRKAYGNRTLADNMTVWNSNHSKRIYRGILRLWWWMDNTNEDIGVKLNTKAGK